MGHEKVIRVPYRLVQQRLYVRIAAVDVNVSGSKSLLGPGRQRPPVFHRPVSVQDWENAESMLIQCQGKANVDMRMVSLAHSTATRCKCIGDAGGVVA